MVWLLISSSARLSRVVQWISQDELGFRSRSLAKAHGSHTFKII